MFCHLKLLWHIQLFQIHQYPPNGPIRTHGCGVRFKCSITLNNYKYVTKHLPKCVLCCAYNLVLFCSIKVPPKKFTTKLVQLHHVTISISTTLLQNTTKFGFIFVCREKKAQECRCKIPSRGWTLGTY